MKEKVRVDCGNRPLSHQLFATFLIMVTNRYFSQRESEI